MKFHPNPIGLTYPTRNGHQSDPVNVWNERDHTNTLSGDSENGCSHDDDDGTCQTRPVHTFVQDEPGD